jgi:hypothetical protein
MPSGVTLMAAFFSYMKLYIKFMVSLRCKMVVTDEVRNLGIDYSMVDMGVVEILENIRPEQKDLLKTNLLKSGFQASTEGFSSIPDKRNRMKNVISFIGGQ